ncbi:MAG: phasin family protein [Rhizobiaceae bacterium]
MTAKTNTTASKTKSAATGYFEQVRETIENMTSKVEVPAAARDFVTRTASSAAERAEKVHETAGKMTSGAEKIATAFVGGYANFTRGLLDMTLANVQHTLSTVEKVAGSKSLSEAMQVQADFVRDNARANYDRVRGAAENVRTVVTDGAKTVQAEIGKIYDFGKKAA